jgi:DNA-binding CsgD family transcriptional regulator
MGRWSNLSEQGERLQTLVEMTPSGPEAPKCRTPKQVQRRLRPNEITDLAARYKAGATVYELADRFRIHRGTVSSLLERQGVPRREHSLTSSQIAKAIDLYSSGHSLAKIAPELACNPSTVWLALLKAGVRMLALLKAGVRMRDSHGRER